MSDLKPIVKVPRSINKVREGRGFSLGELKEANVTLHDAKRAGLRVDLRRRSVHMENVEALKQFFKLQKAEKSAEKVKGEEEKAREEKEALPGEERRSVKAPSKEISGKTPLTKIKGVGPKTAEKLREVGIESVEELAEEDPEQLSKATGISVQRLSSWINEAKRLVKEGEA